MWLRSITRRRSEPSPGGALANAAWRRAEGGGHSPLLLASQPPARSFPAEPGRVGCLPHHQHAGQKQRVTAASLRERAAKDRPVEFRLGPDTARPARGAGPMKPKGAAAVVEMLLPERGERQVVGMVDDDFRRVGHPVTLPEPPIA